MTRVAQLALVFAGGALGGATRIGVMEAFPSTAGPVPWDLLAVNALGALALGFVVARTQARGPWRAFPAIGPGFLGGFTTFSAFAALHWSTSAGPSLALAVLVATIATGIAAAALGWWAGDKPPTPVDEHAILVEENE